jgi:large subunit ribosomal protein L23
MDKTLHIRPRMSEKTYGMSQNGVYVFDVPGSANKHSVARAVASQFEVTVLGVNITNVKGKSTRTIRKKGRRAVTGQRANVKKAYVTLKEGDKLPFFQEIEEQEKKQAEAQAKADKAAEKAAKKAKKEEK